MAAWAATTPKVAVAASVSLSASSASRIMCSAPQYSCAPGSSRPRSLRLSFAALDSARISASHSRLATAAASRQISRLYRAVSTAAAAAIAAGDCGAAGGGCSGGAGGGGVSAASGKDASDVAFFAALAALFCAGLLTAFSAGSMPPRAPSWATEGPWAAATVLAFRPYGRAARFRLFDSAAALLHRRSRQRSMSSPSPSPPSSPSPPPPPPPRSAIRVRAH